MDSNRPLADLRRDRLATIRAARASIEAFQQEIRDAQRQIDRAQRDIASKEEEINAVNAEIEKVDTVLRMLKDQRATEVRSSILLTHTKLFEMSS
jgi:peptidoglycan hydrolase CwlO-like protein